MTSGTTADRGPIVTTSFESNNLDVIEDYVAAAYAHVRLTSRDPNPSLVAVRKAIGSLTLDRNRFQVELDFEIDPIGVTSLVLVHAGSMPQYQTDGFDSGYGPGEVVLAAQPDRPVEGRLYNLSYSQVSIPPMLLDQVAATDATPRPQGIRLLGHRPVSPAATAQIGRTITYLRRLLDAPETRDEPLLASSASQLLATAILATFPSNAVFDPTIEERHDASDRTLRRAIEYIEANAHKDIAVRCIAAAVPVSIRAVQHAFRQRLGTTPMGYLRHVRMARARTDLLLADPAEGDTVATIAARWGFDHGGRFADTFRRTYGEAPSETLRRQP